MESVFNNLCSLARVHTFPLSPERLNNQSNNFQTYCVKFQYLEGLNEVDEEIDSYHLQANLFDQVYKQFVGNIWIGKTVPVKNKQVSLNQNFYFYSSILGNELLLIVEIVTKSKTPGQQKSIGWTSIPLFESGIENNIHLKVPLLSGSPLTLFFLDEAKKNENADLIASHKTKVEISILLSHYPLLMRLIHLIPENLLFESTDYIPGLVPETKDYVNESDFTYKPKLQKCSTYLLERLSVKVRPTIETAESELLQEMQNEEFEEPSISHKSKRITIKNLKITKESEFDILKKLEKQNKEEEKLSNSAKKTATEPKIPIIAHRRFQVGVYNGFCFIQEPDIYHLLVEPVVTPAGYQTNRRSSSLGSLNYSREECLTLRSDIKIPNVPDDPNIIFVFLVEYGITFQSSQENQHQLTSPSSKCPDINVALAWGYCKLSHLKTNSTLNIPLTGDPYSCPFKIPLFNGDHAYAMTLSVVPSTKQKVYSSSHIDISQDKTSISTFSDDAQSTVRPSYINSSPSSTHSITKPKSLTDIPRHFHQVDISSSKPQQGVPVRERRELDSNAALQEVALVPSSMPLVPSMIPSLFACENNSGSYPKFYGDKMQPIFDHHGHPATVIDTSLHYSVDKDKEIQGSPQINECIFEILALSGLENSLQVPSKIFITFQFYRFPSIKSECLTLKSSQYDARVKDSTKVYNVCSFSEGDKPGYQVKYNLDPSEFENGEFKSFLLYLATQNLRLDIWDGHSLLYFGTVIVPLKYLCRQGKEAVCTVLERDIIKCEFLDDSLNQTTMPAYILNGKFHMRLANIRHPLSPNALKKIEEQTYSDAIIIRANGNISATSMDISVVSQAKPIAQTDRELSKLLRARCTFNDTKFVQDTNLSEERRRKLARMEAVRNMENNNETSNKSCNGMQTFIKERQRDLLSIESYMKKNKREIIRTLLHSSVTTKKVIYPTTGKSSFFEFELENPYHVAKTVELYWKCSEINLITDIQMWKLLRSKNNMSPNVEPAKFNLNKGIFSINMQPKEKVNIPFIYHRVSSTSSSLDSFKASSGHQFTAGILSSNISSNHYSTETKIHFQTEDQIVIAVLALRIQPVPAPFTHVFKFLSLEHSTFKKSIRLAECSNNTKYSIKCSDPEVVCSIQDPYEWDNGDINIHLQAPTNASGRDREFYLFIYSDSHHITLFQTWLISVHPQRRIDLSCIAGQMMQTSFIVRGSHVTNLVKCFSNSMDLQLHPSDSFVLSAFAVQELAINVRCLSPGIKHFQVTMVSESLEQILQSWLVVLSCQKPSVSKAYQVHLSIGKESTKRITYPNTSNQDKNYVVYSSHPYLLLLRENQFHITSGKSYCMGLYFPPQEAVFTETIFLYLNDSSDKNEETYCIKVICQ